MGSTSTIIQNGGMGIVCHDADDLAGKTQRSGASAKLGKGGCSGTLAHCKGEEMQ